MLPFVFAEFHETPELTILEVLELIGFTVPRLTPLPICKGTQTIFKHKDASTQIETTYVNAATQTDRPSMLWSYFG